jgi:hypothetical protein
MSDDVFKVAVLQQNAGTGQWMSRTASDRSVRCGLQYSTEELSHEQDVVFREIVGAAGERIHSRKGV